MRIPHRFRAGLLFLVVVLIWGTTWYAIKLETNGTPVAVSVALRFSLAALLMLGYAALSGQYRLTRRLILPMCVQGVTFFGLNYILVYAATEHLASGLVALFFSTTIFFNLVNEAVWLKILPSRATLIAAVMGIAGLYLVYAARGALTGIPGHFAYGVGLVLLSAFVVSVGNILGGRLLAGGTSIVTLNTYGMLTGALLTLLWATINGAWGGIVLTPAYIGALLYLAILGTVVAFALYFALVREIGPSPAAYTAVAFPVVALLISSFLEGYTWTPSGTFGLLLVLAGNLLVLRGKQQATIKRTNT